MTSEHVVVVLGGLSDNVQTGQPGFMAKVYGPFPNRSVAEAAVRDSIRRLEGGACLVRPLVSLRDTIDSISRDG